MIAGPRRLGRPREFDTDAALAAAMEEFWARGFHETSLADLEAATGLHRGSLYAAFGEKHRLFLTALERYGRWALGRLEEQLAAEASPLGGVRRHLEDQALRAGDHSGRRRGCLLSNSALELLPGDREAATVIAECQRAIIDRLTDALEQARAAGELGPGGSRSPDALARYVFTVTQGLWEMGRTTTDRETLLEVARTAAAAL
jgi:TetR/AcrR family transcriptional regulator, transcriptional repressor for nem operon